MAVASDLRSLLEDDPEADIQENLGGDGNQKDFQPEKLKQGRALADAPSPAPIVTVDSVTQVDGTDFNIIDGKIFRFGTAPNGKVEITYWTVVFTDAELTKFLDKEGGDLDRAEIQAILALATNASKFFARTGVTLQDDKTEIAKNLVAVAREKRMVLKDIGSGNAVQPGGSGSGGADVDYSLKIDNNGNDFTEYADI